VSKVGKKLISAMHEAIAIARGEAQPARWHIPAGDGLLYPITLTPDDNGTLLVTCAALPEVTTFGDDIDDAIGRAKDAIGEALAARRAENEATQ
jgi:predicted RNase H-like HicB family nuclease